MTLLEVPHAHLISWGGLWIPFAARVARREKGVLADYVDDALRQNVRVFVVFDGKPIGAIATRILVRSNGDLAGEIYWLAGSRMVIDAVPLIEQILVRDNGITEMEATGRRGFERATKHIGYRPAKTVLVKRL